MTRRPTVLHVVEALGGGVMVAVRDYIDCSRDEFDHVVVGDVRAEHDTGDLNGIRIIPIRIQSGSIRVLRRLNSLIADLQPAIVHAHSSWAGVMVRMLVKNSKYSVAYTPHCYAFERTDISWATRMSFRSAETVLSLKADAVVAVSPREAYLARTIDPRRRKAFYVPNRVPLVQIEEEAIKPPRRRPVIVATGRLCPQKDPGWYIDLVEEARRLEVQADFVWLGSGAREYITRLEFHNVEVSGWLSRKNLLTRLASAAVYVHTAAWEGAPLAILEAVALRVPIVSRDLKSLRSLNIPNLFACPGDAARWLAENISSGATRSMQKELDFLERSHSADAQREALINAYSNIIDG